MLEQLYSQCYAFVVPSKQEGFGLVHLEAMNFGKPCVGCFDDGAADVNVDGERQAFLSMIPVISQNCPVYSPIFYKIQYKLN